MTPREGAMTAEKPDVIIYEVFVKNPPRWFRKVGNSAWESVSLAPYNGILPVVWIGGGHLTQQMIALGASPAVTPTVTNAVFSGGSDD